MAVLRRGIESDAAPSSHRSFNATELKLAESIENNKNIVETFEQAPVISLATNAGATGDGEAAAATYGMNTGRNPFEYRAAVVESTGTAVFSAPYVSADGLELPLDANVTDGVTVLEIGHGVNSRSRAAFTIGTDGPFYLEATIKIDDVSDLDKLWLGFRKTQAYAADANDYTDMAAFMVGETGASVADGQINIATILNNAATSFTDTTEADWADAAEKTLRVDVDKEGRATFSIGGSEPAAVPSFTFDDGDVVVPFLAVDNATGSSTGDPGISVSSWKCGKK